MLFVTLHPSSSFIPPPCFSCLVLESLSYLATNLCFMDKENLLKDYNIHNTAGLLHYRTW